MSVTLMAEALRYAAEHDLAPPRRLVLYVMADAGDDDGRLWHGQKRLQRLTGLSLSTIRKAIREFEDLGILTTTIRVREEGRGRTSNLYVLSFHATADGDRSHELPPPPGDRSADQPPGDGGEPHRPSADQPPGDGGPIDGGTVREPSVGTTQAERAKSKVGGKVVTDDEFSVVTEIVAAFNAAAGTSYQPDSIDHLRPIVGRIREFPDLTGDDHRGIIAAVFRLPWWSGAPGPQVIYGSKGQFERSIETWRASGPGPLRLVDAAAGTGHPPTPDERRRLICARARLRAGLPASTYRLWLKPLRLVAIGADTIYLEANEGIRAWAERRYSGLITAALAAQGLPDQVSFGAVSIDDHREAA